VVSARDALVDRSREIETELDTVRRRLDEVEPEKEIYAEEIHALESERASLLARLSEVEQREEALRARSGATRDLEQERRTLEELLDEAARELHEKDEEIRRLERQAKRGARSASRAARDDEHLFRRLRTLYKNLEIDDAALSGIARLGDDGLKLRAEEALKRLNDDPEAAGVRRKVGGLPPHLSIFELGFAGRGRIYTTKGQTRRFRVLLVGAKNTQKPDLEYLSRLPKGT
jgi:chromosome segregation ATPase